MFLFSNFYYSFKYLWEKHLVTFRLKDYYYLELEATCVNKFFVRRIKMENETCENWFYLNFLWIRQKLEFQDFHPFI